MVRERRGTRRLRETASEIDISPATLMRVESGRVPDVSTFGKICRWLGEDPGSFLGFEPRVSDEGPTPLQASAHLKADKTPQPATVQALARMILLAAGRQKGTLSDQ